MTLSTLQSPALRYFLEVVRSGSVTEAAERLDVAPSAVSRQIARLEKEMNTLLFERHARGMVPNAAGELLAAHAKRTRQDIDRLNGDILALRGVRQGRIRLVCTEGYAFGFVPALIASFRREYAGIRFELQAVSQHDIPLRIRDGEADIGLTLSLTSHNDIRVELRTPAPVMAVVAPDHPMARKRTLSLAQLAPYPMALPDRASTLRQLLEISCSRQQLVYDPVFTSSHLDALITFAAASGGVTFCGELAIRERVKRGDIVCLPLRDREMNERHFEVQTLAGRPLPEACKAFIAHVIAEVRR
ncbi:LysR family regulatory protein [Bordetella ansorpii]|uniref:LysR family regulatory protein n=1 Tax=Bordetella ansorpii TaxID=288768 RepID=A0A157MVX1_9BORD|nr:LysR family transcriptional regulator [Bordetella ansorpii]SAI13113.1 LysR family regulatory protein [Bordetella ansorpii]